MTMNERSLLIVDDEEEICDLIKAFVATTPLFSSIIVAKDGREALQKMTNQEFDVVIMDNFMPKKTGLELINLFTQGAIKYKPAIIFISGAMENDHVITALQLGIKNILVKPFTRQKLIDTIKKALKMKEGDDRRDQEEAEQAEET